MLDEKSRQVINKLIEKGIIPSSGEFVITQNLLDSSFETFQEVFPKRTNKPLKKSEIRFANKLAYLNFMKLLEERTELQTSKKKKNTLKQPGGFLYLIENVAFPGYLKVGITKNMESRLASYQTYDPHRRYTVKHYKFVENTRKEEKKLLDKFSLNLSSDGEWITINKAKELFSDFMDS